MSSLWSRKFLMSSSGMNSSSSKSSSQVSSNISSKVRTVLAGKFFMQRVWSSGPCLRQDFSSSWTSSSSHLVAHFLLPTQLTPLSPLLLSPSLAILESSSAAALIIAKAAFLLSFFLARLAFFPFPLSFLLFFFLFKFLTKKLQITNATFSFSSKVKAHSQRFQKRQKQEVTSMLSLLQLLLNFLKSLEKSQPDTSQNLLLGNFNRLGMTFLFQI